MFPVVGFIGIKPISAHGLVQNLISSTRTIPGSPNSWIDFLYLLNSSFVKEPLRSLIELFALASQGFLINQSPVLAVNIKLSSLSNKQIMADLLTPAARTASELIQIIS